MAFVAAVAGVGGALAVLGANIVMLVIAGTLTRYVQRSSFAHYRKKAEVCLAQAAAADQDRASNTTERGPTSVDPVVTD